MNKSWIVVAVGCATLLGVGAQAQLLLTPGNSGPMPNNLSAGPAGFIAFNASPNVQDGALNFTAQVDSAVTVGNAAYGPTALTFWYRVSNVDDPLTGPNMLQTLIVGLPGASSVVLDQTSGSTSAALLATLPAGGALVAFNWLGSPIVKGHNSTWLRVDTEFTQYKLDIVGVQDGTKVDVPALVPVPEPATYAGLFALGLAGFAAFRRFRA